MANSETVSLMDSYALARLVGWLSRESSSENPRLSVIADMLVLGGVAPPGLGQVRVEVGWAPLQSQP